MKNISETKIDNLVANDIEQRINQDECSLRQYEEVGKIILQYEKKYFVLVSSKISVSDKENEEPINLENELSMVEIEKSKK